MCRFPKGNPHFETERLISVISKTESPVGGCRRVACDLGPDSKSDRAEPHCGLIFLVVCWTTPFLPSPRAGPFTACRMGFWFFGPVTWRFGGGKGKGPGGRVTFFGAFLTLPLMGWNAWQWSHRGEIPPPTSPLPATSELGSIDDRGELE